MTCSETSCLTFDCRRLQDYAAAVDLYARALLDPEADGASRAAILSNRAIVRA